MSVVWGALAGGFVGTIVLTTGLRVAARNPPALVAVSSEAWSTE